MAALVTAATAVDAAPLSTRTPVTEDAVLADLLWWVALTSAVAWLASLGVLCYCLVAPRRGRAPVRRPAEPQPDRTVDATCLALAPTRAGTSR